MFALENLPCTTERKKRKWWSAQLEPKDCSELCSQREFQSSQTLSRGQRQSVRANRMLVPRRAVPEAAALGSSASDSRILSLLLRLLLRPLVGGSDGNLGLLWPLCTSGLSLFCLRLMGLGNGYDDGQDTDELEDGSQEESIPQQVLQEGGLRHLGR